MWHSDRPLTQQRLSNTLASLLIPLPEASFIPFVSAFWKTIYTNYSTIDSLRLDKFLYLIRRYVNTAFVYLQAKLWPAELLRSYLDVVRSVLCEEQGKVSDGLRYHIIDTWLEELDEVDRDGSAPVECIMSVIQDVAKTGRTKVLRQHAKVILKDERLKDWKSSRPGIRNPDRPDDEEESE